MAKPASSAKHAPESKTTSPAAPKEVAAPAPPKVGKKPRSGKPSAWRKLDNQLSRFAKLHGRIVSMASAIEATAEAHTAAVALKLHAALKDMSPGILDVHNAFMWLDAEGVVAAKLPASPKFAVGDAVRVTKKALPKYTRSGLYSAEFLADMVVDKVSTSGKEFLCRDPEGAESVHVRYGKHLERVG